MNDSIEQKHGCTDQQQSVHKQHTSRSVEQKEIRRRRSRTVFTASQLVELERVFEITHHPNSAIRKLLAETINTPETTIQVWFQNRRAKLRWMREAQIGKRIVIQKQNKMTNFTLPNSSILLPLTPTSPSPPATPHSTTIMFHHTTPNIVTPLQLPTFYRKAASPHLNDQSLQLHLALGNPALSASDSCIVNKAMENKPKRFQSSSQLIYQQFTSNTHSAFPQPNKTDEERKLLSVANLRLKAEQHKRQLGLWGAV